MGKTRTKKKSQDEQWALLKEKLPGNLNKKRVMRLLDNLEKTMPNEDCFETAAFRIMLAGEFYGYTDTADVFAQADGLSEDADGVADESRKTLSAKTLATAAASLSVGVGAICNKRERSSPPNTAKEKTASGKKNPFPKMMRYKCKILYYVVYLLLLLCCVPYSDQNYNSHRNPQPTRSLILGRKKGINYLHAATAQT